MTRMDGAHRCNSTLTHRVWFLNKHILVGNGQPANSHAPVLVANDISNYIPEAQNLPALWQAKDKNAPGRVMSSSSRVPRDSPVCPCSAAVPRRSHTCGADSSCRLCSGGRASPCFPPGTPHAWPSYLVTHKKNARMLRFGRVVSGGWGAGGWGGRVFLSSEQQITHKVAEDVERIGHDYISVCGVFFPAWTGRNRLSSVWRMWHTMWPDFCKDAFNQNVPHHHRQGKPFQTAACVKPVFTSQHVTELLEPNWVNRNCLQDRLQLQR